MTLSEFKAWFSGFTESMDSTPNEKQWARIKARVAEIDDKPVTYPVFIDRYVRPWSGPYWVNNCGSLSGNANNIALAQNAGGVSKNEFTRYFDSHSAMLDLGKAEYQAVQ